MYVNTVINIVYDSRVIIVLICHLSVYVSTRRLENTAYTRTLFTRLIRYFYSGSAWVNNLRYAQR